MTEGYLCVNSRTNSLKLYDDTLRIKRTIQERVSLTLSWEVGTQWLLALIFLLFLFYDYFYDYSYHHITSMLPFLSAVTVTMSEDYVQSFTTSFRNLPFHANSAYISVTDKSTITPTYPLAIIQDCTFSPVYLLSCAMLSAIYAVMIAYQYGDWVSHTSAIITL